ncbi:MAG: helix-turn-helix transcriptional regulator [Hyphomicrobiaceae bacterium]
MTADNNEGTLANAAKQSSTALQPIRLITKAELRRIVPYSPQHILRLEERGLFPRRVQLGANRVGWLLAEIEHWIAARVAERDACTERAVERGQQITYQNEK